MASVKGEEVMSKKMGEEVGTGEDKRNFSVNSIRLTVKTATDQ